MKRDVEQTWGAGRIESALLRERINYVAYEVVRITQAFESPGSPIEPISAYATLVIGHGRRTQTSDIDRCERRGDRAHDAYGPARRPHSCLAKCQQVGQEGRKIAVQSGKNLRKKQHCCGRRPGSPAGCPMISTATRNWTQCRFLRRRCGISTARPRSRRV